MDSVLALFTCFNRREKTRQAVKALVEGNPEVTFSFVVVDDGSSDGTAEMLMTEDFGAQIQVLRGDGSLFYSGGMRKGMENQIFGIPGIPFGMFRIICFMPPLLIMRIIFAVWSNCLRKRFTS